ncbi:helix-turn-helix transcriptional regulator [Streptomyces sp. NPDC046977]|uniref:PadR family transcriptional regulator n=1 Tax=Streptomyces sp. NPDC046977 TaxID=3154703 RepID=UPI0033E99EBC
MAPVFAHGRLRLYLLKLLDEAPRHGYEVIRLLEERFQGLYAPSAGTVYPRLAKLEQEGLVTHSTEGGRKVYSITDAGRAELASRGDELADLENEIRDSVSSLAAEIREDVRGAAGDLRREIRAATQQATRTQPRNSQSDWKEQVRRSKEEIRQAREEARNAKRAAREAQDAARDEVQRIARRVQEEVQDHVRRGDWQAGVREGLAELTRELGSFGRTSTWPPYAKPEPAETPEWGAEDAAATGDPARDLERLLDRFRDDVRDAARDHGVDAEQLREVRRHLSTAAAHIGVVLRGGHKDRKD